MANCKISPLSFSVANSRPSFVAYSAPHVFEPAMLPYVATVAHVNAVRSKRAGSVRVKAVLLASAHRKSPPPGTYAQSPMLKGRFVPVPARMVCP